LGWILELRGRQLVHAAAVATADGAVLIAGSGGSGKSTTALTCLEAGMDFLGDDYFAVSLDPPTVHSVYATAKIADAEHPACRQFPIMPSSPDDEKFVLQLYPAAKEQLRRSAPLRAIVTPEVVDRETTVVVEVDRDRLEHAATFTTLAQLPHAGAEARARIGQVLDEVPGGLLQLGRDRAGVVEAIRRLAANPTHSPASLDSVDLPPVTVVIPVYNGARFLATAVESVLAPRYPRLEIVVVDDGSEDDLASAIAALPVDVRVHHQATSGPAAARNAGIRMSTSDLVAFLDVDDKWPPASLLTLVRDWQVGGAAVVIGRAQVVELDPATGDEQPIGTPETAFTYYIGSALYERGVFDRVGLFDPDMLYGEDIDWFTRMAESDDELRRLSAVTLVVRRHGQNMTEGRDLVELHVVRALKKALDRKRNRDREA
ncbi:MAG: glycosyltransferase, partial [Rhodoglobus sp.]|nr:glycosyltransferase [Rhodoglobus sp.]